MPPVAPKISLLLQLLLLVALTPSETRPQHRQTAIESGELYLIVKSRRFGYIDHPGRIAALEQSTTADSGESYYLNITGADRVVVTDGGEQQYAYRRYPIR